MKVNSAELKNALQTVIGVISNNPVLPILEDYLFEIKNNTLTVTATDLETFISTSIKCESETDFNIAIPAKILLDTIRQLPPQELKFDFGMNSVTIISAFGEYQLATESGSDYPKLPESDSLTQFNLPASLLSDAINKTMFATSNDQLRPALCGVLLECTGTSINFVSTDAQKLAYFSYPTETDEKIRLIIPKKPLSVVKTALTDINNVTIKYNAQNAFFEFSDYKIVCRLIDAKFPEYTNVIPNNDKTLNVGKNNILGALKRLSNYANSTTNQIRLKISENLMTVSAENLDTQTKGSEKIPCLFNGALEIGFNSKFLIETISNVDSEEIKIELSAPNRAGIVKPANESDYMFLVMPVILNNN